MCLDVLEAALTADRYSTPQEFAGDMRLIFNNAMSYNPPDHSYHQLAQKMLTFFDEIWATGHDGNDWGQPYGAAPGEVVSLLKEAKPGPAPPTGASRKRVKRPGDKGGGAERKEGGAARARKKEEGASPGADDKRAADGGGEGTGGGKALSFLDRRLTNDRRMHLQVRVKTDLVMEAGGE
jgi:hypothetical protein